MGWKILSCALLSAVVLGPAGRASLEAQARYDLLLKGGHVIDPRNGLDTVLDVAVAGGKIARVAREIPAGEARQVVDVRGLYVTPGAIDLHAHVFYGTDPDAYLSDGPSSVPPDGFTFRAGVTTVVDAGGAGWRNFPQFKTQVIDRSQTRVLAFLNIVGHGMKGGAVEQDLYDMNPRLTAQRIAEFPGLIVGIKTAHYRGPEWDAVDRSVEAGRLADVPVMVDFGTFGPDRPFEELVLSRLRPGDIYTHQYRADVPMLDRDGKVRSYLFEARKRGVLFDVGHGSGSFSFSQAAPAVAQGFLPDSLGTDLHTSSMVGGMKDMTNLMSKFLNLGMSLPDVVHRATWGPARIVKRDDLGHLSEGAVADVAVFRLIEGDFGFLDARLLRMRGKRKLECELTLREGRVMWDLNGIAGRAWDAPSN